MPVYIYVPTTRRHLPSVLREQDEVPVPPEDIHVQLINSRHVRYVMLLLDVPRYDQSCIAIYARDYLIQHESDTNKPKRTYIEETGVGGYP